MAQRHAQQSVGARCPRWEAQIAHTSGVGDDDALILLARQGQYLLIQVAEGFAADAKAGHRRCPHLGFGGHVRRKHHPRRGHAGADGSIQDGLEGLAQF